MGKKNRYTVPGDSMIRSAWSSVALSSGLIAPIGSWSLTDRFGAAKLTGMDPGTDGTYLITPATKAVMYSSLSELTDYFRSLR